LIDELARWVPTSGREEREGLKEETQPALIEIGLPAVNLLIRALGRSDVNKEAAEILKKMLVTRSEISTDPA
jgi:hypothetical protein